MYVKIIKSLKDHWYHECENGIFEVKELSDDYYELKDDNSRCIRKQDCEIINISKDKITSGMECVIDDKKISEKLAFKLLSLIPGDAQIKTETIIRWKNANYIKQSREDETKDLKKKIKKKIKWIHDHGEKVYRLEELTKLQKELLEIYEKEREGKIK